MELKTFEIFTSKYSKILQAENMAVAVFRFMELVEDTNDAKDIIAIIDTEQGKEFLTSENSLHKHDVSGSLPTVDDAKNFAIETFPDTNDNDQISLDIRHAFVEGAKFILDRLRQ